MQPHAQSIEQVLKQLSSSESGLNPQDAEARLKEHGFNELKKASKENLIIKFLRQFKSFLIYILLFALILSAAVGEYLDAIVIGIILLLNALLGFIQEYKAEKSIEALQKLASPKAIVLRNGKRYEIESRNVVPGDIILLETGNKIPADSRLITNYSIYAMESALTGESMPVEKQLEKVPEKTSIEDRTNMVYAGTTITAGRGMAIVVKTGMHTQLGKIAGLIHEAPITITPLQEKLKRFGKWLGGAIIAVCIAIFIVGILQGISWLEMMIAALSLAVAAVPEGLPAVVTITLALGVQQMVKKDVLVRRLPAVETLGGCEVICSDKTGTLTHDEMTVRRIFVDGKNMKVTGEGYEANGTIEGDSTNLDLILRTGLLCNASTIDNIKGKVIGDPTEGALLISAKKGGVEAGKYMKTDEIPFSSERKIMSVVCSKNSKKYVFTKGAVDAVLEKCTHYKEGEKTKKITKTMKKKILEQNDNYAKEALRVLAFAYKEGRGRHIESGLVFVGLQAMMDPPRKDAIEAIKKCKKAGIKVVMITGDHKLTAESIAKKMGIEGKVMDGIELSKMKNLDKKVSDIGIYARVAPAQKVKIVEAFKKAGYTTAMTGDGVNDAPALKQADIGVAMGITGTDVAKEASDMIVLDDNFASIVAAVEKGRSIFDNIQKFVEYLLSCNLGEVLVIFFGLVLGMPLPLIAIQILWMNLITDGLPALALGMEPTEPGVMEEKPKKKEKILEGKERVFLVAVMMTISTIGVFYWAGFDDLIYARTMAFTTLVCLQLVQSLDCRSLHKSVFKLAWNPWIIGAIMVSFGLQLLILYTPLAIVFEVIALGLMDWAVIGIISAVFFTIREMIKVTGIHTKDKLKPRLF